MTTNVGAGAIAIVGFDFDNPDEFAFVATVGITPGTAIRFADHRWHKKNAR